MAYWLLRKKAARTDPSWSTPWARALLISIGDAAPGQVVGTDLHLDLVARQDADAIHPHLPRVVSQDLVAVGQLHLEHGVLQGFAHRALQHDCVFLALGQCRSSPACAAVRPRWSSISVGVGGELPSFGAGLVLARH